MEKIIQNTDLLHFLTTKELLKLELLNKTFNNMIILHPVWKIRCIFKYPLIQNTINYDINTSRILAIAYDVNRLYLYVLNKL